MSIIISGLASWSLSVSKYWTHDKLAEWRKTHNAVGQKEYILIGGVLKSKRRALYTVRWRTLLEGSALSMRNRPAMRLNHGLDILIIKPKNNQAVSHQIFDL